MARRFKFSGLRGWPVALPFIPALLFLFIFYFSPLASLVFDSFKGETGLSLHGYEVALSSPSFSSIFLRTATLSGVVTIICLLLGYPVAYILARLKGRTAAVLLLLVSVPYITSVLVRTYGWIIVLSPSGLLNKVLIGMGVTDSPIQLVFNSIGVYVGMVQVQLPLMIFPLYAAMKKIDRSLLDAAANLGSNKISAMWHVYVPLSRKGIVAGCTLVFLSCLGFYVTPALLGGAGEYMLAQAITVRVTALADFSGATVQATILLIVALVLLFVFRRQFGLSDDRPPREKPLFPAFSSCLRTTRRAWQKVAHTVLSPFGNSAEVVAKPIVYALAGCTLFFLILPLLVVIPIAFTASPYLSFPPPEYSLRWFKAFFSNRQWLEAALFSLKAGGLATLIALALTFPVSMAITRAQFHGRAVLYLALISPIVLPHVVVALALYFFLSDLNWVGTPIGIVVAYTIIGFPYALVILVSGAQQLDRSLEMAASNLGARTLTVFRTIIFPQLLPSILSASFFAFIMAFDDVIFGIFLAGTQNVPLPIRMWDDIRMEISPQVAVVATLLLITIAFMYIIYSVSTRFSRMRTAA
ncbi:MAG: ABC transporter permease subunit [Pusillimonas sp.]